MEMENNVVQEEAPEENLEEQVGALEESKAYKRAKYIVRVTRDKKLLKAFVKFSNRVRHPRVTVYMVTVGVMLLALPFLNEDIALPGRIISFVVGALMVPFGIFRHNISVSMMADNPATKLGAKLTYLMGSTGIHVEEEGKVENFGSYKKIYRLWEDETFFYIGMNDDDLLVFPKADFERGDVGTFRDFILEKSRVDFRWVPTRPVNIIKNRIAQMKWNMQKQDEEDENERMKKQKEKGRSGKKGKK